MNQCSLTDRHPQEGRAAEDQIRVVRAPRVGLRLAGSFRARDS